MVPSCAYARSNECVVHDHSTHTQQRVTNGAAVTTVPYDSIPYSYCSRALPVTVVVNSSYRTLYSLLHPFVFLVILYVPVNSNILIFITT